MKEVEKEWEDSLVRPVADTSPLTAVGKTATTLAV